MKAFTIFLLFTIIAFSQLGIGQINEELDDPDENQYFEQLLDRIFQQISLKTADSIALDTHGYSPAAIELIIDWQKQVGRRGSNNWLVKHLQGDDLILMEQDVSKESEITQIQIRQRLQYSPSLAGWRVLNKGRIWSPAGSVNILTEQDPGESQLTDHTIFTVSSYSVPHLDNVILGDFHMNWGGGLILNQQGSRLSLNPSSLIRRRLMTVRPHYSSRELDYFHGLAGSFSTNRINGSAFISSRKMKGLMSSVGFKEDADGIHPNSKSFLIDRMKSAGLALETQISRFRLYGSTLYNPQNSSGLEYELGLAGQLNPSHYFQLFTDNLNLNNCRMLMTWIYSTKSMILSFRYRRYYSEIISLSGSIPTLLGSSAFNEDGISVRLQVRPARTIQVRYALETGSSVKLKSQSDFRTVQHHKIQFRKKMEQGVLQFDYSRKREYAVIEGDGWLKHFTQIEISKAAISLQHHLSSKLKYRLNLKSASNGSDRASLIQQGLSGENERWRWTLGYVRYMVPEYALRLSIYEASVAESFSFYTGFDDGERWFLYLKRQAFSFLDMELKLVQSHSFDKLSLPKQLGMSFQMSVVL